MNTVLAPFFERKWNDGSTESVIRFFIPYRTRSENVLPPIVIVSYRSLKDRNKMIAFLHKFEVERGQVLHAGPTEIDQAKLIDQDSKVIVLRISSKTQSAGKFITGRSSARRPREFRKLNSLLKAGSMHEEGV